jgi:ankyrin repeat protein
MNRRTFLQAIDPGDVDAVRAHLDASDDPGRRAGLKLDAPASRHEGFTPLLMAVVGGHAAIIDLLLAAEADPNRPGRHGELPIFASVHSPDCLRRTVSRYG